MIMGMLVEDLSILFDLLGDSVVLGVVSRLVAPLAARNSIVGCWCGSRPGSRLRHLASTISLGFVEMLYRQFMLGILI